MKERKKYLTQDILMLFKRTTGCKYMDRFVKPCKSLERLLFQYGDKKTETTIDVLAAFMANGMCIQAYRSITKPLSGELLKPYLRRHPVFKNGKEEDRYRFMLMKLEAPELDLNLSISEAITSHIHGKSCLVYKLMTNWLTDTYAFKVAYNFYKRNLKLSDVGKLIFICIGSYIEEGLITKHEIKSLTVEEGFNIDVEGLL